MKILLLGFTKIKFMPYLSFYLEQIDCIKNDVNIVYWNRDLLDEDLSKYDKVTLHEYKAFMEDGISKVDKLKYFFGYRRFVTRLMKQYNFDIIISLHTLPGLCVLDKLLWSYKKNYILDYRDSTFENNKLFGYLVMLFARNARVVFVSSDAFRKFLPCEGVEIITSHNILADSLNYRNVRRDSYVPGNRIRISFWGLIRDLKLNLKIMSRLANDSRFELHYYGRAQSLGDKMEAFIKENEINNIFLHGEYVPKDRYEFARRTDIIHNCFSDSNMLLAMSNKYYDGLIFYIPQLCMTGSYMGKRCAKQGVGCELDPNKDNFADMLYEYYHSLNQEEFERYCDVELESILKEYEYGNIVIKGLLNN